MAKTKSESADKAAAAKKSTAKKSGAVKTAKTETAKTKAAAKAATPKTSAAKVSSGAKERSATAKKKVPSATKAASAKAGAAKAKTSDAKKAATKKSPAKKKTDAAEATSLEQPISDATSGSIQGAILDPIGDTTDGEGSTSAAEAEETFDPELEEFDDDAADEEPAEEEEDFEDDGPGEEDQHDEEVDIDAELTDEEEDDEEQEAAERPPVKLERLQKILSQAGVASRRHAEEMIEAGRVMVNGKVVNTLGAKADVARDHIRVDGKLLQGAERHRYFVLNKPKGYVTTVSDPEGRATVMEFFANMGERLYPVGRLDYQSEGLLLMTNDGALANQLTKAASGVEKTYLVKVAGQPTEEELDVLRNGVAIESGKPGSPKVRTAPAAIQQVRQGDNPWFEVVLIEGRNRELRKMFGAIGHFVEKIRRVGYGPLVLDQEPGKFRELDAEELAALKLAAEGKLKPRRGKSPLIIEEVGSGAERRAERSRDRDRFDRRPPREGRPTHEGRDGRHSQPPARDLDRREGGEFGRGGARPQFSRPQGDWKPSAGRHQGPSSGRSFERPAFERGGRGEQKFDRPAPDRRGFERRGGPDNRGFDRSGSRAGGERQSGGREGRFGGRPGGFNRPSGRFDGRPPRFDRATSEGSPRGEGASGFEQRPSFRPRQNRPGGERPDFDRPRNRGFDRPSGQKFGKSSGQRFDRPLRPGFERRSGPRFDTSQGEAREGRPQGNFNRATPKPWGKRPAGPPRGEGSRSTFGGGPGRTQAPGERPNRPFGGRPGGDRRGGFSKPGFRPGGAGRGGPRPNGPRPPFKRRDDNGKRRG